jgi:hypothetical protein
MGQTDRYDRLPQGGTHIRVGEKHLTDEKSYRAWYVGMTIIGHDEITQPKKARARAYADCIKYTRSIISSSFGGRPSPAFGYTGAINAHSSPHGTMRSISGRNFSRRVVLLYFSKPCPVSSTCSSSSSAVFGAPTDHIADFCRGSLSGLLRSRNRPTITSLNETPICSAMKTLNFLLWPSPEVRVADQAPLPSSVGINLSPSQYIDTTLYFGFQVFDALVSRSIGEEHRATLVFFKSCVLLWPRRIAFESFDPSDCSIGCNSNNRVSWLIFSQRFTHVEVVNQTKNFSRVHGQSCKMKVLA